jgi:hypothetical protein
MKKTFTITHPKIKPDRQIEAVKHDINKYLKRERNKKLPEGVDFWDFACKFGPTAEEAEVVHAGDIGRSIETAREQKLESFYVEIVAKPGHRTKKPAGGAGEAISGNI